MRAPTPLALLFLASLAAASAQATAPAPGQSLAFVACPMVRDTPHPCWLAEYDGQLYYLGPQGGSSSPFIAPQLRHKALIEGRVSDAPRICGGIVLEHAAAAVLPEVDDSCNTILPADGHANPPTIERGPAPTPIDNTLVRARPAIEDPKPPFDERRYQVLFTFDWEEAFIGNPFHPGVFPVQQAARYARALGEDVQVRITGYRARARLSDGTELYERQDIAQRRADYLAQTLRGLGVPAHAIHITPPGQQIGDTPNDRRAVIQVIPANQKRGITSATTREEK
jgi:hypothetical protein